MPTITIRSSIYICALSGCYPESLAYIEEYNTTAHVSKVEGNFRQEKPLHDLIHLTLFWLVVFSPEKSNVSQIWSRQREL